MSLFHAVKSRHALTKFLRNLEGRFIPAASFRATPVHQRKIEGNPYTQQPHPYSDALYTTASIIFIVFPLLASSSMLSTLAEDKFYHEAAYYEFMSACERSGIQLSHQQFKEFKSMYKLFHPL